MKVSSSKNIEKSQDTVVDIEFGIPSASGNSSAGEKKGFKESSVRLAWRRDGRFDPISTAELPYWGACQVFDECLMTDFFSEKDMIHFLKKISESLERKSQHLPIKLI